MKNCLIIKKIKFYHIIFFISVLIVIIHESAMAELKIYKSESIEPIKNSLSEFIYEKKSDKILVIMPLESVILNPSDKELVHQDIDMKPVLEKIVKKIKLSKKIYFKELILTEYEQKLTDGISGTISMLQENNVPLIVFSKNFSGNFNKIPFLEVWTWSLLIEKGIDLSKGKFGNKQIIFNKKHKKIRGSYPTFYKGLLSSNSDNRNNSPQSVIATLLAEELLWLPDVVYIIHPEETFIKSINHQFKSLKNDIQVIGFIYENQNKKDSQNFSLTKFVNFWQNLVDRLNQVKKKEETSLNNPYEQ